MTDMSSRQLPPPRTAGPVSLEEALCRRRSRREFSGESLASAELGQLLWAAHGVTGPEGRRNAPSAGNTDPLEVPAVTPEGVGRYDGATHTLEETDPSDLRAPLSAGTRNDEHVLKAGAVIVLAAVAARTAERYPERVDRYVALGLGHAAQNILLQAEALGLWAYPVGAHDPERVAGLLRLPQGCVPLYLVPVGRPATG